VKTRPPAADEDGAFVELTYPGAEPLYAERCKFRNPRPPFDETVGFETKWYPDLGEQRAVANGAPIILRVWGQGHPPVSVGAGQPGQLRVLVDQRIVDRALGNLYGLLRESASAEDDEPLSLGDGVGLTAEVEPDEFLALWTQALQRAITQIAAEETAPTNGTRRQPPSDP
jgi:hypothetical protein